MSDEDGNTSWNLSFDDDFDTSSDSLAAPSSLLLVAGKRVVSNASDEGYKSASNSHARLEGKPCTTKETFSSHQNPHAIKQGSPATRTQKQRTLRSMGLGHMTSATQKASTQTPPSRHRQVNSMVYSSSPSPKWQGKPVNTSPSSKRVISPHNSPLMSSFARAREQQERISEGTLSGLIMRFIRNRTISTLSLRLALLIVVLLLTSLVLTRDSDHTPTHAHYSKTAVEFDDSEASRAVRGASGTKHTPQFVGTTHMEEEIGDFPGIERWKQEERRLAHARIAKSFQQASDAQESKEDTNNEVVDGDESGLFEDALIRADLAEAQNRLADEGIDHTERSEQEGDKFAADKVASVDVRKHVGNDRESTGEVDAESISRAANLNRDSFEMGRHVEDPMDEATGAIAEDNTSWKDERTDESEIQVNEISKALRIKQAPGRAAILAQVEASRELALLEYQRLQGERYLDIELTPKNSQSDFVKAKLEDRDVTGPSKEEPPLQRKATNPPESEAEDLEGIEEDLESITETMKIEDDSLLQNGEPSLLEANAAAVSYEDALTSTPYDTLHVDANDLDRSAQEDSQLPPNLPRDQEGGSGRQKRTGLIKQVFKPDTASQDEASSFEENIAIMNARKGAKKVNAAGRLVGKRRMKAS